MSDAFSELEIKLAAMEAKLDTYQTLLAQVSKTCGQHNCNCPGSSVVKNLARDLGAANIELGAR
jgi:hypothetical protein